MKRRASRNMLIVLGLGLLTTGAVAQTTLPKVNVTAPRWQERHGGYLISGNFKVDSHISAVIFPARPFHKGDILGVRFTSLQDDEYFILQECISVDCTRAYIVRAWNVDGALGVTAHLPDRVWIGHRGKYFMWMQRIPMSGGRTPPFDGYEAYSPPMVFNPAGTAEQFRAADLAGAQKQGPEKVVSSKHDGAGFMVRYESGTRVLIQRMHALN